jgi:hypothetical protein
VRDPVAGAVTAHVSFRECELPEVKTVSMPPLILLRRKANPESGQTTILREGDNIPIDQSSLRQPQYFLPRTAHGSKSPGRRYAKRFMSCLEASAAVRLTTSFNAAEGPYALRKALGRCQNADSSAIFSSGIALIDRLQL